MKLLTAVAVIALASATAAFADPGTSAPTNLNSANQSSSMSSPGMQGQDMQGQAGIQKPVQQGAMNNAVGKPAKVDAKADAKIDKAKMAKSNDAKVITGSKQDQAERAQTEQLNAQQLASGGNLSKNGQSSSMSPQTAAKPPEDNKQNCIEGKGTCTPAIPQADH